jgi:hypothetical protein
MSHHFDTAHAKEDPRLNICDLYVFKGSGNRTVFVQTCCADAGISSPDIFHPEGTYAFRIDLNKDAREELVFKFRFGPPEHAVGDEHRHTQTFRVLRASGAEIPGDGGELLAVGETGRVTEQFDVKAFAGLVPELWAADAGAFFAMLTNLFEKDLFDAAVFEHKQNLFHNRNVMAMVLEVPNSMLAKGEIGVWATVSLFGHAPEVQVARWGLPLITHLFLANPSTPELPDRFHQSGPHQDAQLFGPAIATLTTRLARSAGAAADAQRYGVELARRLCPAMLPYEVGSDAEFTTTRFNGRRLTDDAYDVMVSLATHSQVADGVAPNGSRTIAQFPYYGRPVGAEEQAGLTAIQGNIGYGSA